MNLTFQDCWSFTSITRHINNQALYPLWRIYLHKSIVYIYTHMCICVYIVYMCVYTIHILYIYVLNIQTQNFHDMLICKNPHIHVMKTGKFIGSKYLFSRSEQHLNELGGLFIFYSKSDKNLFSIPV